MTERELKKLSRRDLLEMLLALSKENEELRQKLVQAEEQLNSRNIMIENSGSLAEAALRLNGVFEAAQAACEQYVENMRFRKEQQAEINELITQQEKIPESQRKVQYQELRMERVRMGRRVKQQKAVYMKEAEKRTQE